MNSNNSVIEAVRNIDSAFDEFKKHNDERVDSLLGRIEAVEAGASRPKGVATRQENEHKAAFLDWIRNPHDGNAKRRLDEVQAATLEGKDVLIGDAASGGYALPEVLQNEIERRVVQLNPIEEGAGRIHESKQDRPKNDPEGREEAGGNQTQQQQEVGVARGQCGSQGEGAGEDGR
jgi:HK97 family phage major capsid protein